MHVHFLAFALLVPLRTMDQEGLGALDLTQKDGNMCTRGNRGLWGHPKSMHRGLNDFFQVQRTRSRNEVQLALISSISSQTSQ